MMNDKVCSVVLDNQRITIRNLSKKLWLSFGLEQSTLTEDFGTTASQ